MLFETVKELRTKGELDKQKWSKVRLGIQIYLSIVFTVFLYFFYQFLAAYIEIKEEFIEIGSSIKVSKEFIWLIFIVAVLGVSYPISWVTCQGRFAKRWFVLISLI